LAETQTPNYKWVKPDIGGDASTWGNVLNSTIDAVDSVVFANQQAGVPIGSITMFGGATPPANWLICDGSSLPTTGTYAALFAVLGYAYGGSSGNFNLPNLQAQFPLGANPTNPLGQSGGTFSYAISVGNLPAHAHLITDVAHNHSINQSAHLHPDPGHTHGVSDPGHAHSAQVSFPAGVNFQAGSGFTPVTANTSINGTGISIQGAGTGIQAANANISLNASGTGLSTTQSVGSGTPLSVVPPYVALNYIIRFQ
jgi:microcystin-dependent protein